MKTVITGGEFWDFDKNPVFLGKFVGLVTREKDDPADETKKAGDTMGYNFEDEKGETHIIGNSHQIQKALTSQGVGVGSVFRFTFLGKGENSKGQPFNRFKVEEAEPGDAEYKIFHPETK